MPGAGIHRAKRLRAGALGQSSRFYNIYGQRVSASAKGAFKGGQGWTTHNPSIGSILSMGIMKQNKNAGGNTVCGKGPGPTSCVTCVASSAQVPVNGNNLLVGKNSSSNQIGYITTGVGSPNGTLTPNTIDGNVVNLLCWNTNPPLPVNAFAIQLEGTLNQDIFATISILDCENKSVRTYNTNNASFGVVAGPLSQWVWDAAASGYSVAEENAYWNSVVGKTLKVIIDGTNININDYCVCCPCKPGPSGSFPCRSKVDANGIRKHC